MTTDNKTLADVQPGGRVRLGDRPKDGEVLVEVSGLTGSGKSAIAGEIEILCKALGLDAEWVNGDEEKRLTHADWIGALEMYKPKVVIVERNIPRAALSAQPYPGGQDATSQVVSRMVSTAPEKIFLQIGDGDYSDEPFPHPAGEEITWCSDSIVESEVAYVRADLAAPRAHSVDLSRFRSLARWVANSAGHGINSGQRRMGEELLALIDSHAVGK